LWVHGLSFEQRLSYLSSFFAYFESFQKFTLLLIPVLILVFDIFPMRVGMLPFLLRWLPYFSLNILANKLSGRGIFNYFKTEKYNLLKTIIFIQSTLTLVIRKPLKFKVTPKSVDSSVYHEERLAMSWYMGIFGLMIIAMMYAVIKIFMPQTYAITWDVFGVAFVWVGYNSYVVFLALREILTKRHSRKQYRFQINAEAKIFDAGSGQTLTKAEVIDLSVTGAGLLIDQDFFPQAEKLDLEINPDGFDKFVVPIEKIIHRFCHPSGKDFVGLIFTEDLGPQRGKLFEHLFIHLPKSEERVLYQVNDWDPFKFLQRLNQ